MRNRKLKIGSRGSQLALVMAHEVGKLTGEEYEISVIKTSGDRFLNVPLQGRLEKGFFTKEIEESLIEGNIDLAMHSLKDLPTSIPEGLIIGAIPRRASPTDLLILKPEWESNDELFPVKKQCIIGATSLRRQAQLKLLAPGCVPTMLRGNVNTRIRKCQEGQYGAIILARAGIERLKPDLKDLIIYELNPLCWLPAPGQGAIAVQTRVDNTHIRQILNKINNTITEKAVQIERQILSNFGGGCHTAFGAFSVKQGDLWKTHIGIEDPEKGWIQASFERSVESSLQWGPENLKLMSPIQVTDRKDLCWKIQL